LAAKKDVLEERLKQLAVKPAFIRNPDDPSEPGLDAASSHAGLQSNSGPKRRWTILGIEMAAE
jgi:hypothetical protein